MKNLTNAVDRLRAHISHLRLRRLAARRMRDLFPQLSHVKASQVTPNGVHGELDPPIAPRDRAAPRLLYPATGVCSSSPHVWGGRRRRDAVGRRP
jgi:hypothetical protein